MILDKQDIYDLLDDAICCIKESNIEGILSIDIKYISQQNTTFRIVHDKELNMYGLPYPSGFTYYIPRISKPNTMSVINGNFERYELKIIVESELNGVCYNNAEKTFKEIISIINRFSNFNMHISCFPEPYGIFIDIDKYDTGFNYFYFITIDF